MSLFLILFVKIYDNMFTHSLFSRHFSWFWSVAIKTKIAPDVLVREF
jgi:hypothetical protein